MGKLIVVKFFVLRHIDVLCKIYGLIFRYIMLESFFVTFFLFFFRKRKRQEKCATYYVVAKESKKKDRGRFLAARFQRLVRCAMHTFLQKYSPIARIFGIFGCRGCLCIHFYKNAHTHSHFRDIYCKGLLCANISAKNKIS